MSTLTDRLGRVASRVDFDQADLARVLELSPRTIARWLSGATAPRPEARERLLEVIAVLERLLGTLVPEAAHDWLFTPNAAFEHHKPVDLLRRGDYRRVLGAIDALADGVFV